MTNNDTRRTYVTQLEHWKWLKQLAARDEALETMIKTAGREVMDNDKRCNDIEVDLDAACYMLELHENEIQLLKRELHRMDAVVSELLLEIYGDAGPLYDRAWEREHQDSLSSEGEMNNACNKHDKTEKARKHM